MPKLSTKALHKAHGKYQSAIGDLENKLSDYIDFDFSIFYQPSDGFVIVKIDTAHNARLDSCISEIESKGKLTVYDYLNLSI